MRSRLWIQQVQPNWNEANSLSMEYIKNKPSKQSAIPNSGASIGANFSSQAATNSALSIGLFSLLQIQALATGTNTGLNAMGQVVNDLIAYVNNLKTQHDNLVGVVNSLLGANRGYGVIAT